VHEGDIPASREALLPRPAGVAAPEEEAVDLTFSLRHDCLNGDSSARE